VNPPFGIGIIQIIGPAENLTGLVGQSLHQPIFWRELEESFKISPQRRSASGLESQHVGPVILLAERQNRSAGQQGIGGQTKGGLRESLFQLGGQAQESFEFAVLFDGLVIDESGGDRRRAFGAAGFQ